MPALLLVAGCKTELAAPSKPAYASCACRANADSEMCQTNITTDSLNCGACGVICDVGAPCVASQCDQAPAQIARTNVGTNLKTNASAVFWQDFHTVYRLPFAAGATPEAIATDQACGEFGVDDANLYYWACGVIRGAPNTCSDDLTRVSLVDGTRTVLVPSDTSGASCGALVVGATSVYELVTNDIHGGGGNPSIYTIYAAKIGVAGQTLATLATLQTQTRGPNGELDINSTSLVFSAFEAETLHILPITGGPMTALPLSIPADALFQFAVDNANVYVVTNDGSTCAATSGSLARPTGNVIKVPLDGRPNTILASFSGEGGQVVVDATHVYWATDTDVWKVPIAGGAPQAVAGNLWDNIACSCSVCGLSAGHSIALSPSEVYVAMSGQGAGSTLLEVAK
jgi:hypothetical protein